jgi:SAM-dependent methyltransferase
MSAEHGFRISWAGETSASGNFANVIHITETICTPFAVRQFQLLGLLPPVETHPRVLDNACGSGRQAEVLQQAYADAGKPIDITCCDISPGMISSVERRIKEGNWGNVNAHVVNAEVYLAQFVSDGRILISHPIRLHTLSCRLESCSLLTLTKCYRECILLLNLAPKSVLQSGRNPVFGF